MPILSILSEQFECNNEINISKDLFKNSPEVYNYYIPGTTHIIFSDVL
jgi:hypothetical protein